MKHSEKAREIFSKGYNCSQAVVAAFSDVTGLDFETSLKASSSFGAGMGKMRSVCGAVTGMFIVAGLLWGTTECDAISKEKHYTIIQQTAQRFKDKYDTIICAELLKNLKTDTTPKPSERTNEYYAVRPCARFVEYAFDRLDEIIKTQ